MKPSPRLIAAVGLPAAVLLFAIVPHYEGMPKPAPPAVFAYEGDLDDAPVYQSYLDPVGIVTACMGHTRTAERDRFYTEDECNELLTLDLLEANATVDRCVTVELAPYERAAYASFAFNVGPGKAGVKDGFCVLKSGRTPTFLMRLNAGDRAGACRGLNENGSWTKAKGKQLRGLIVRRADERALCEGKLSALRKWGLSP